MPGGVPTLGCPGLPCIMAATIFWIQDAGKHTRAYICGEAVSHSNSGDEPTRRRRRRSRTTQALRAATYHCRAYMPPICLRRAIIIRLPRNYPAQRDQRPTLDHAFPNGVPGWTRRRCQGLLEADLGNIISASRDPLAILCPCSLPVASRKMRGPGRGC